MSQLSRLHTVPLWLIVILLISGAGAGLLAYHVWNTIVIPLEVKEPLEMISYPSELSLFPGENEEFDITVRNHASVNYSVTLEFSLDNATYQDNYVTFSNELYNVIPGQQILSAWLVVESQAPPANSSLTIRLVREPSGTFMGTEQLEIQGVSFSGASGAASNTIIATVQNTGTSDLTVDKYKLGVSGTQHDITDVSVTQGNSASVTCTTGADGEAWVAGTTYDIYLITSTGKQFPYRATAP